MGRRGGGLIVRSLMASVAVLVAAGGLAAATVDPPAPATVVAADGRAGATGLGQADLLDEPAPTVTVAPAATSTTAAVASLTTTTKGPDRPTTTKPPNPRAPATTTATAEVPAYWKTMPNPPGYLPAASSWEAKGEGVSVRMRLEPSAPVAGQPVRIHLDYAGVSACCLVQLHFGDGTPHFLANHEPMPCVKGGALSPGSRSTVVSHTYATPGAYRVLLTVMDADLCTLPANPAPADENLVHHVELFACIAVGPGTASEPGCEPLPPYGPYFPR